MQWKVLSLELYLPLGEYNEIQRNSKPISKGETLYSPVELGTGEGAGANGGGSRFFVQTKKEGHKN
jgi:hypothetical protein